MKPRFFSTIILISFLVSVGCTPSSIDLSKEGTANSYIISESGTYKFKTVKGNSSESVGNVASVKVLWESFGTNVKPKVGALIKSASVLGGYIEFKTNFRYKEGNAVVAALDANGTILWSWHIWLTDKPEDQVYYNDAGIMMDRNLGATSATPGDASALGLMYQWGRKDPFLGASSIKDDTQAKSTGTWPSVVHSNSYLGTIEFAQAHPTTFIRGNNENFDWYYTGDDSIDKTRWQSKKTIYDPCPAGYRVPDGDDNDIWSKSSGSSDLFVDEWNNTYLGRFFISKSGDVSSIWYPGAGYLDRRSGQLEHIGDGGYYWSVTPITGTNRACYLAFNYGFSFAPVYNYDRSLRSHGHSVRCCKE